jgi:hypothetical protein
MTTLWTIARRAPHLDEDRTTFELRPWHVANEDVEIPVDVDVDAEEDVTVVRPRWFPEAVERLSLPSTLREDMLPAGETPGSEVEMQIGIVRLVRALGRDYLAWYGASLRTDAASVERMQRHLLALATEVLAGRRDVETLAPEVVRHGALLGEILARRAGGVWVDLFGPMPGAWRMAFPSGAEICPVARVQRFVMRRAIEGKHDDLVALFEQVVATGTAMAGTG